MSDNELYADRNDAIAAEVCGKQLVVTTRDGRVIHTPLAWFPWLEQATPEQQADLRVFGTSIHWNQIDDGVSMEVILLGRYGT
jgi:hypothetical protein